MALVLCQGCQRHVRGSEASCPFCKTTIVACAEHVEADAPGGRVTRSHVAGFVVGAVAVSSVLFGTACPAYGTPPDRRDGAFPDAGGSTDTGSGTDDAR